MSNKIPPTRTNIETALHSIHPDLPRDQWLKIGTAVKDILGDDGKKLFDQWSSTGNTYNASNVSDTWRSIKTDGKVTVGTLFFEAAKNGWKPDADAVPETDAERQKREQAKAARDAKAAQESARKAENAAKKALALFKCATPAQNDHPYLLKKRIAAPKTLLECDIAQVRAILGYAPKANGIELSGRILIAAIKVGYNFSTAELIDEAGRKSAIAGGIKAGGYWMSRKLLDYYYETGVLYIAEGIATAYSGLYPTIKKNIFSQCRLVPSHQIAAAVAAFSAGNLPKVAAYFRSRYPSAYLIILADNGNGNDYAVQAAQQTGAAIATPTFTPQQIDRFTREQGKAPTDFNDLHQLLLMEV